MLLLSFVCCCFVRRPTLVVFFLCFSSFVVVVCRLLSLSFVVVGYFVGYCYVFIVGCFLWFVNRCC